MNVTNINNYQTKSLEDPESIRCNCESLEPIKKIVLEFGYVSYTLISIFEILLLKSYY